MRKTIVVLTIVLAMATVSFAQQAPTPQPSQEETILAQKITIMQQQLQLITNQYQQIQAELPKAQAELKALQEKSTKKAEPAKEEPKKDKK